MSEWSAGGLRLHIRHGRAAGLSETDARTEEQRPEQEVGEGQDDVEIAVHVAMVQEMVAVKAKKMPERSM